MWSISGATRILSYEPECHIADAHRYPKESRNCHSFEFGMQVWRGSGRAETNYSSMIPLFSPIIAAWVRSLAPNLERMDLTRLLTVSSVIES